MKNELGISFGEEKIYRVGASRWCVLDLHGDVLVPPKAQKTQIVEKRGIYAYDAYSNCHDGVIILGQRMR